MLKFATWLVLCAALVLTATVAYFWNAPPEQIASTPAPLARLLGYAPQVCFDARRDELTDPDSAQIIDASREDDHWKVSFRAADGAGEFSEDEFHCSITGRPVFVNYSDEARTRDARRRRAQQCAEDVRQMKRHALKYAEGEASLSITTRRLLEHGATFSAREDNQILANELAGRRRPNTRMFVEKIKERQSECG